MAEVNIVSAVTWFYLNNQLGKNRAIPYLDSVGKAGARVWVVCADFQPPADLKAIYPDITFVHSPEFVEKTADIQPTDGFGSFLHALTHFGDEEVVMACDADVVVQRAFTEAEKCLTPAGEDAICIGPNCGDDDNLAKEGQRIGVDGSALAHVPCYNGGAVMARVGVWKRLKAIFDDGWDDYAKTCSHRSRSQFYLCKRLYEERIGIVPMPRTLHCHGHFGIVEGVSFRFNKAFYNDQLVMLRHAL